MIRSNVPMPLLYRLRMRASLVARRAQSGVLSRRQRGGVEDERAIWTKAAGRHVEPCSPEVWSDFIEHYERFTGALCCAAMDGSNSRVEREFAVAKRWFDKHYGAIASRVRPFLDAEFHTDGRALVHSGRRHEDMLESLLHAPSLKDLLLRDTGDLLPRIGRISEAVYRCHESFQATATAQ